MQQWPSLGELMMHLVRRVEDLEAAIDKRMELLTKKMQVLERQSPESPPPENMNEDNKSQKQQKKAEWSIRQWRRKHIMTGPARPRTRNYVCTLR